MKRLRRSLVAAGVLVAAAAATACSRREPPARPAATVSRHLAGDPPTLDPITMLEEESARVAAMMFRPLIGIDRDLKLVPGLAKSWSVSQDGLVYEFHLDPEATWEDGKPVTSDDVRFTLERIHDPKANAANWSWGFEDLAGIETPERGDGARPIPETVLRADPRLQPSDRVGIRLRTAQSPARSIGGLSAAGRIVSPRGIPTARSG